MRPIAICLSAAIMTFSVLPGFADELVDGNSVEKILGFAVEIGDAGLEAQRNGDPKIHGSIDGVSYSIYFSNCEDNKDCTILGFYSGFKDLRTSWEQINAWNGTKMMGRARLDRDQDAVLEMDVNLKNGVSGDNLLGTFGLWRELLTEFVAYTGFQVTTAIANPS